MAWVFAIVFFILAIGMYFNPEITRPIVGSLVSIGDQTADNMLKFLKVVLS